MHVVGGVAVGRRGDLTQLGPVQAQRVLLLAALGFRDDDDRAVAAGVAHQRQPDAGVAGRPLDDGAAGAQKPALFRVAHDCESRAVLDRPTGVQELRLAQDLAARRLRWTFQANQRRVADGADKAVADVQDGYSQGQVWIAGDTIRSGSHGFKVTV